MYVDTRGDIKKSTCINFDAAREAFIGGNSALNRSELQPGTLLEWKQPIGISLCVLIGYV